MPIADFEQLCKGFCEIAGMQAPDLAPNDQGVWAATLHMRGVPVSVLQFDPNDPTAYLIAEFGSLPEDQALPGWLALLDTNLSLAGKHAHAPAFSRNPGTGEVLLQWGCPLADVTAVDVYQRVIAMVDLARHWRTSHFLAHANAGESPAAPTVHPGTSAPDDYDPAFEELLRGVCQVLQQPTPELFRDGDLSAFALTVDDIAISVMHIANLLPDKALVLIQLDPSLDALDLGNVTRLMDANFMLLEQRDGAAFTRIPATGTVVLKYPFELSGATAHGLLTQVVVMARFVRDWRDGVHEGRPSLLGSVRQ
jgi:hypothetical protein